MNKNLKNDSPLVKKAVSCFVDKDNCSQAIFSTYGSYLGMDPELCLDIAKPFGGGIARLGNVCGAVTGALMVLGLKYGKVDNSNTNESKSAYDYAVEFINKFTELNGTIMCRDLISFDLTTPEKVQQARDTGVFNNCHHYVRDAAILLEELLNV